MQKANLPRVFAIPSMKTAACVAIGTAWTMYQFITNLQGDVLSVYRLTDRAIVASYSYDSWGNILSATGELAEENPFRYRGYYYDAETSFYYVSSR